MLEEDRGTVRAVAWSELFPWLILIRCFRLSIGLRPLLLSSVAAVATVLGWSLFGLLFSGNPGIAAQHEAYNGCPWNTFAAVANEPGLVPDHVSPGEPSSSETEDSIVHRGTNPIVGTWEHLSRPFREVFTLNMGGHEFGASKLAYSLLCALWALAVWAIAGGAITRDAAVQLASGERAGWGSMIDFAKSRWKAYVWAPLLPFIGILFGTALIAVFGLILMRWNVGVLVAGILWPLILAGGFLLTLLLGLAVGWPLMFATISTEGTDSFDALSRSYAYAFQRPLHYLFYTAVVTVVGLLGWVLVFGFVQTLIGLTHGAACWGSGGQFVFTADPIPHIVYEFASGDSTSHLGWLGDLFIRALSDLSARLLAVGYLYSYFWVSASGIYLLLRRDVDDTELDEVYLDDAGTEESIGLPETTTNEIGAPIENGETPLSETE